MDDPAALRQVLARFPTVRAAVIGDLMADRFIYGEARRLSPEAPVPVVHIRKRTIQPGGAANVANNVLSLGGKLALFGVLGDDEAGRDVHGILEQRGADLSGVRFEARRPTTVKTRVVAQAQHLVRFDEEETGPIDGEVSAWLLDRLSALAGTLNVVVFSDYAKGLLGQDLVGKAMALCRERGLPVVADPKPANIGLYKGVDVIKPNLGEALRLIGWEQEPGEDDMAAVCRRVRERSEARGVIVTAGWRGMYVLDEHGFAHIPGTPREVYDVAGAGDSTLAAIALALACGASLHDAAHLGNLAGGIAVEKLGIATVSAEEMLAEIEAEHEHA